MFHVGYLRLRMVVLRLHHGLKCGKRYNLSESKNFWSFKLFLWKNGIFAILWIGKNRYFAIFTIAKKIGFCTFKTVKKCIFCPTKNGYFFYSNSLWVVVRIVEAAAVVLFSIVVWVMSFYREKTKKKLVTSNHIIINYYYMLLFLLRTCQVTKRPHPALHQAGYKVSMYFSPNYCLKAGWSKQLWLRE